LRDLGQFEKAAAAAQEAIRLNPQSYAPYYNLMTSEIEMNRWAEAKVAYEQALTSNVNSFNLHDVRYWIAFLERDFGAMQRELEWEKTDPRADGGIFVDEAGTQLYFGHAKAAREFLDQGLTKGNRAGFQEVAAVTRCKFLWGEFEIGETKDARRRIVEALRIDPSSRDVKSCAALVLARLGDPAAAERMAAEISAERPLDLMEQKVRIPALKAAALLAEGRAMEAVKVLETSVPYFHADGVGSFTPRDPAYLRGIALLKLKRGQEAALQFQKFIDSPGLAEISKYEPLAHLQLARAYAMMGDTDAARKSYQDFLALWKDADPDIPIYRQAKAEYAKLNKVPAASRQLPAKSRQLSAVSSQ
jgi:tetratricopeptide (TPR) repeat protein